MPQKNRNKVSPIAPKMSGGLVPVKNISGFEIKPLYEMPDVAGFDTELDLGRPGEFPYVRGIHPTMYRGRSWTIRQLGSLGPPDEANKRIRQLIKMGATGISVCFDMPTIMGRDSDDPLCEGEVGSCGGAAIDSVEDMKELLAGIDLEKISINFVSNAQSAVILAMFCVVAEHQGVPLDRLTGTMQNDILKEYQAQKSYYFPPRPSMRLIMDTIGFCAEKMPRFNPISISGYHIASAGATPVQELAFTLANGFTYVEEGMKAGLKVDSFAPRLSFFFKVHNDLFENVAKFRAARRIWARTMKEKYRARDPRSLLFRVHTQTSGSSLTAQQAENNIIRTTLQALSAVLAGTQSLHTNSFDEALSIPTPRSERLALRTQQIIGFESGAASTIDPLAGSYYVEALTNQMEYQCVNYFKTIDDLGGVISAVEKGFFHREISEAAFRYQQSVENKERIIVGLNAFTDDEDEIEIELRENDPGFEQRKVDALRKYKQDRDHALISKCLNQIIEVCSNGGNVIPTLISSMRAGVTLGEAIDSMRRVFGSYREEAIF